MGILALVTLGGSLELAHPSLGMAAWADLAAVTGTALRAHAVGSPAALNCAGGGLLAPLTYSWPSRDPRYTYRVQLVDSSGTVRRTDTVPESGQSTYGVTYAAAALPLGTFSVRVTSSLTGSTTWTSAVPVSRTGANPALSLITACG